jgi:hypothetical protein
MIYGLMQRYLPAMPRPVKVSVALLWYGLMVGLAVIGIFEPQAEFVYLAM